LTYSLGKIGGRLTNFIKVSCVKSSSRNEEAKQGVNAVPTEKTDARTLRRTRVPIPDRVHVSAEDVRSIRESNGVSQAVLALYLGTSTAAVTQWEQGLRTPTGATATLLSLIKRKGLEVLM
jgi:DNA-binding transcriptional regulator YiaG